MLKRMRSFVFVCFFSFLFAHTAGHLQLLQLQTTSTPSCFSSTVTKRPMFKTFAHCSLSDLEHEISAAASAHDPDASAARLVLPSLRDAELTAAVLQRYPLVRAAGALVCTGTAESKHAWCRMLRNLIRASGAHVSKPVCLHIYLSLRACARRGHVQLSARASLHPFIERFKAHPALSLACPNPAFVAELTAHPLYCRASRSSVQRWEVMFRCRAPSQAHAQQWHVYGIDVGLKQRRTLLARAALCELLVLRLMRFGGTCHVRNPQHHATCLVSRRHFFVSKNLADGLFQEGQRLCEQQRFSDAAKSWGQAALLQHAASHAFLSHMLFEGRQDVAMDDKRAFELAAAGAGMGCAHSKGMLGDCLVSGTGVAEDVGKGLVLARESAAAGSCFGQLVVGRCYEAGVGVAQDDAEAVRLYRLAAAQGNSSAQCNLGYMFYIGRGVAQDYAEAVRIYRLAAAQGHAVAQNNLGVMFYQGHGVAQDKAEAIRWFRLAAAEGDTGAAAWLERLGT
jgi:TPR repeat protein